MQAVNLGNQMGSKQSSKDRTPYKIAKSSI
jgi:hypothetical protein